MGTMTTTTMMNISNDYGDGYGHDDDTEEPLPN